MDEGMYSREFRGLIIGGGGKGFGGVRGLLRNMVDVLGNLTVSMLLTMQAVE
jgi:hypothetical protein